MAEIAIWLRKTKPNKPNRKPDQPNRPLKVNCPNLGVIYSLSRPTLFFSA